MTKLLIIQTAFIGDVILATPLIEKLKDHYPYAQLDFLLRKGNENLLHNNPDVSSILIWDKTKNKKTNLFRIIKLIRKKRYDYVINLQRYASTGLITAFSRGKVKIGFSKNPFSFLFTESIKHTIGNGKHEVERNTDLIVDFTDIDVYKPKLFPSKEDFQIVSQYKLKPYICIAPTSVWFTKQYPKSKWIDLIHQIGTKYTIYLIGGKSDKSSCDDIISQSGQSNIINLCGKLSFLQTSALISNAVMNYVNDSAPLHMASAMDAPVTAIFCSTVPEFGFGPLSKNSKIVESDENLHCRPCGLHGYKECPEGHFKCAYSIQTNKLLFNIKND